MLEKLKDKLFHREHVLKMAREDHASAARANEIAHSDLKRACINSLYPNFCKLNMDGKHIVNPR